MAATDRSASRVVAIVLVAALAVVVAGTAAWSAVVLTQHDWLPWARWVLLVD